VNRTPAANPPDTAEALRMTPIPATFQAATVKPTNPNSHAINFKVQPGGRVVIEGVPLRMLIQAAWNLTDEMLAGAPRWLAADRYDIVAKADVPGPEMEIEEVLPMLRALVVERFKLVSHMENRPAASYTLIAVNPKLKKADPASRTKWVEGPAANSKDPRDKAPMLARLVTVQNMTMARFAEKLEQMAPGYIHTPVLDGTGLEGGYDFTLSFSPAGATQAGGAARGGGEAAAAPPADAVPAASDPNGAVSLFDAIERQLGLKLKEEQRPVPVLVVDHIEQRPVGN